MPTNLTPAQRSQVKAVRDRLKPTESKCAPTRTATWL